MLPSATRRHSSKAAGARDHGPGPLASTVLRHKFFFFFNKLFDPKYLVTMESSRRQHIPHVISNPADFTLLYFLSLTVSLPPCSVCSFFSTSVNPTQSQTRSGATVSMRPVVMCCAQLSSYPSYTLMCTRWPLTSTYYSYLLLPQKLQ